MQYVSCETSCGVFLPDQLITCYLQIYCVGVGDEVLAGSISFNSLSNSINGITRLIDWDRAIYSPSVVDRAMYGINLERHMMGQLAYDII